MGQNCGDRDALAAEDVRERLAAEPLMRGSAFDVEVRGGVAHVRGRLSSRAAQAALRRALQRLRGIHAVWDVVAIDGEESPCVVDIGCGAAKQWHGAIGVDRHPYPAVDMVADLEQALPFADASVDHVFAVHFLEHVHRLLPLMNEVHRILKPHGALHAMVPNKDCINAYADPTHVRYFHLQTFKYFCQPRHGQRTFLPLNVTATRYDIFADLQPAPENVVSPDLARFFD